MKQVFFCFILEIFIVLLVLICSDTQIFLLISLESKIFHLTYNGTTLAFAKRSHSKFFFAWWLFKTFNLRFFAILSETREKSILNANFYATKGIKMNFYFIYFLNEENERIELRTFQDFSFEIIIICIF